MANHSLSSLGMEDVRDVITNHKVVTVTLSCILLCLFTLHFLQSQHTKDLKTPYVSGLPFLGSILSLLDPHAALIRAQRQYGDYFTFHLFTTKFHLVLDPHTVSRFLRNAGSLSFRETERFIDLYFFDYPRQLTDGEGDEQFTNLEDCIKPHLTSSEGIALLNGRVWTLLLTRIKEEALATRGDTTVELFEWVRERVFEASTKSLFGQEFPTDCIAQLYWSYEASLTDFLSLPRFMLRAQLANRTRLVDVMAKVLGEDAAIASCSGIIRDRLKLARSWGYNARDQAKICIDILFALQANATPMAFWMLGHVISDTRLYDLVKAKVRDVPGDDALKDLVHDEWITSVYDESLRMHAHATLVRKCMEETILDGHTIHVGDYVVVPTATYLHSPKIWHDPYVFDEGRFDRVARAEEGVYGKLRKGQVLVPFGGGVHYCPGRHFAKLEIVAMTLLVCKLYNIESVDALPSGWDKRKYGTGAQQPMAKMRVKLSRAQ